MGFQCKYKTDISKYTDCEINCTGFVGSETRAQLNKIYGCKVKLSASLFKVTSNTYSEKSDINNDVVAEFGPDYRVADWNDVKAYVVDTQSASAVWADGLGISDNGTVLVTYGGQRYWGEMRHYFIQRDNAPSTPTFERGDGYVFLVHDDLGDGYLMLGSWYDLNMKILAIKK